MGVKKKPTLKILFRQFAISLIVMLVAAIIVPSGLEGLAVNAGLATRANLSELQVQITLKRNASSATAERLFHF